MREAACAVLSYKATVRVPDQLLHVSSRFADPRGFHCAFCDRDQSFVQESHVCCRYSMLRMGLAPCAPFNVTQDLMISAAKLARQHPGVRLHTHLAENIEDIEYMERTFKCRPGEYIK